MKKIDFKLGGHPLTNDNLKHIQEGSIEDTQNVLNTLFEDTTNGFRLLTGFVVTDLGGGNYTWTAGTVSIDGVVHAIDEQTTSFAIDLDLYGFYELDAFDASIDPVTYENANSEFVHLIKKVEFKLISANPNPVGTVRQLKDYKALHQLQKLMLAESNIQSQLNNYIDSVYNSDWVNIAVDSNDWTIIEQPRIRRVGTAGKYRVEFKGIIRRTANTQNSTQIFTNITDAFYSPSVDKKVVVAKGDATGGSTGAESYTVLATGNLQDYTNQNGCATNEYLYFDNTYYFI